MLKSRDQMWTRLSQLPKDFPSWFPLDLLRAPKSTSPTRNDTSHRNPGVAVQDNHDQTAQQGAPQQPATARQLGELLQIPTRNSCAESDCRLALQDRGQFLARQDRWHEVSELISTADQQHRRTPGGLLEADLLAYGARADVINAVEHALEEQRATPQPPAMDRVLIEGIMSLEAIRQEHAKCPYLTALVALAHIDIAWVWRASVAAQAHSPRRQEAHLRRAAAHFERAATLLSPFKDQSHNSAFLSTALCALYAGQSADTIQVADAYGRLIDLDPENPRHMRALGTQMLPRANGSYSALELEARRCAAHTQEHWGAGGYTWVYFDALALDDHACTRVDIQFFMDGLQDILCTDPSQEMVNRLAAYCAVTLGRNQGRDARADAVRQDIAKAARWLIRSHLRELHPLIWAHAAEGFDNNARVPSLRRFAARGQDKALTCIADVFQEELKAGHKIAFSPQGYNLIPA